MKTKSILQLVILVLIIILILFFFKTFFTKSYVDNNETNQTVINKNENLKQIEVQDENNIITNLEYKSFDAFGNQYVINSKAAESDLENINLLKLIDVSAIVYVQDKEPIYIYSDYAIHDKISFDTKFFENVQIKHLDFLINSNNLDLMYENNLVVLYNIKDALYGKSTLEADKITLDILTRDVSVNMYKNENKIKIIYK
mgnify:CR=1 FL=1